MVSRFPAGRPRRSARRAGASPRLAWEGDAGSRGPAQPAISGPCFTGPSLAGTGTWCSIQEARSSPDRIRQRHIAPWCAVPWSAGRPALAIAHRDDLEPTHARNDAVLRLGRDSGGFFYPVRLVYPFDGPAAADELGRVAAAGAAWLKLHPNVQRFDVAAPVVAELVRNAARRELPVLFDAYSPWDANQPARFAGLATAVPEASIILAHGPGFPQLLFYDILARHPGWRRDVWIDISVTGPVLSGGPFAEKFVWVLRKVGVDRVIFGGDYPLDEPPAAVRAVISRGFTDGELAAILRRNTAALLKDEP